MAENNEIQERHCSRCDSVKPLIEFYASRSAKVKFGRMTICIECITKANKAKRKMHSTESFDSEMWIPINGFNGMYEVSSFGRVKSADRLRDAKTAYSNGVVKMPVGGRILTQEKCENGYRRVTLAVNGENKRFLAHRLVALAFIPNPENKPTVNHKWGIKHDNRVTELEWATKSEQMIHAYETGLQKGFNPNRNKVAVTKDGETTHFESQLAAKNALGINKYSITLAIRNNTPYRGYEFRLA